LDALESLSREQLIQVILDQHRMIEQLRAEIEQLKRRGGAAPFSKDASKPNPKPPGRKPGQGFFRFRNAPEEGLETEATAVPVAALCCLDCGGELGGLKREIVSITDTPDQPRPEVRRYAVEVREKSFQTLRRAALVDSTCREPVEPVTVPFNALPGIDDSPKTVRLKQMPAAGIPTNRRGTRVPDSVWSLIHAIYISSI
jgi:hypothetical protein